MMIDEAEAVTAPPVEKPEAVVSPAQQPPARPQNRAEVREARRKQRKDLKEQKKRNAAKDLVPPLSGEEVADRLRLHSGGLVEDLHAIVIRQIQAEEQRESRLDGKAQGLLITAGLSLTVSFTLGGMLLQHPEYLSAIGRWPTVALVSVYMAALVAGLTSSVRAVRALYVTDGYRSVSEHDALNEAELSAADAECVDPKEPRDNARAQWRFRRYMMVQYWQIWQQHFVVHEAKARMIKSGQRAFLVFLVLMMVIGLSLAIAAVMRAFCA